MKKRLLPLLVLFMLIMLVLVTAFTPQDDIDLRGIRGIKNGTTINATNGFYHNGSLIISSNASFNQSLTDGLYINLTDESNLNVNSSNSTTYWAAITGWVSGWFKQNGTNLEYNESKLYDKVYNESEVDSLVNAKASPGTCSADYAVQNTTTSGVQCVSLPYHKLNESLYIVTSDAAINIISTDLDQAGINIIDDDSGHNWSLFALGTGRFSFSNNFGYQPLVLENDTTLVNKSLSEYGGALEVDGLIFRDQYQVLDESGIDGSNITGGTVADARIASSIARDTELPLGDCGDGEFIQNTTSGAVECFADQDTTYTAGYGIVLTGTEFSTDNDTIVREGDSGRVTLAGENITSGTVAEARIDSALVREGDNDRVTIDAANVTSGQFGDERISDVNASKVVNYDIDCPADYFMTGTNMSNESITCVANPVNATFNQTLTDTLYATIGSGNDSWNESHADTLYASLLGDQEVTIAGENVTSGTIADTYIQDSYLRNDGDTATGGYNFTGDGVNITQTSTTGNTLLVERDLNSTETDGAVVYIEQDNAGDNQNCLNLQNDGTGVGLSVKTSQGSSEYTFLGRGTNTGNTNIFYRDLASAATAGPLLQITQDNAGDDQEALKIQQDGNIYALNVEQTGSSSSYTGIFENTKGGDNTCFCAFAASDSSTADNYFFRNLASANTAGPVVFIEQDNAGDDQEALKVQQDGAGAIQSWYANTTEKASLNTAGDLQIDGAISKGSGTFTIDHPLDPTNKLLQHSFIESPEMRNMYYGQETTGIGKSITIILPDWFEALNGNNKSEFNYQITAIGKFCDFYVSREILDNSFEVTSDKSYCSFSWIVSAIRHDAFAEVNRIQVEIDKAPADLTITYETKEEEQKIGNEIITNTYEVPIMPNVDSRRKGTCIHEESCIGVDSKDIIDYPEEPTKKFINQERRVAEVGS